MCVAYLMVVLRDLPLQLTLCAHLLRHISREEASIRALDLEKTPIAYHSFLACCSVSTDFELPAAIETIEHAVKWYSAVTGDEDASVFLSHIEDKLDAVWSRT